MRVHKVYVKLLSVWLTVVGPNTLVNALGGADLFDEPAAVKMAKSWHGGC